MTRLRSIIASLLVATLVAIGPMPFAPAPVRAVSGWTPRVAVIVGPVGSLTSEYRQIAREAAAEARRWTPDVVTVFSPYATWPAVRQAINGASVVIYLGHGNGWPSPYRSALYDVTQNGFGLNPVSGAGDDAHQYFGADYIRHAVTLAPGAVVLLHRLCYASGNSEPGVPEGTITMARQRVDNFAAGFLDAGAGAVIADAFASPAGYLRQLLGRGAPAITAWRNSPTANGNTFAFASVREPGALDFMDPDNATSGFYRSIVLAAHTAETTGPGGPGTGEGTSVPSAIAPHIIEPVDPPAPSLAALGAVSGPPVFADRPIAASTTTLTVPLRLPSSARLPAGLQVGVRWTPIELSAPVATGPDTLTGVGPGPASTAQGTGSTAQGSGSTAGASTATSTPGLSATQAAASPSPATSASPAASASPVASPSPMASSSPAASPGPTGSTAATGAPSASLSPDASASPAPSPGASPDPSAGGFSDVPAGADQVVAEQPSSTVDVAPATFGANALQLPIRLPTAPGRYRLVVTLHGPDGVALDAETQALVPALLVRVAGPIEVAYKVPARVRALPGSAIRILATVANAGTLSWSAPLAIQPDVRGPSSIDGPAMVDRRPVLVGRWLPLDAGGSADDALPAETRFSVAPGTSTAVTLALRAPSAPGTYLVVLDVLSPVLGSLAARGATPSTVIVVVAGPSS